MSSDANTITPGAGRLAEVTVNGHRFAFRRPSRADVAETRRRMAARLVPGVAEMHEMLDGRSLEWECALEIGLQPQVRNGAAFSLGEAAPDHWFQPVLDSENKPTGARVLSYLDVPNDEFSAVIDALVAELGKKKT